MLGHGGGELKTAVFHLLGALAEPVPPGLYVAGERSALDEVDAGELATSCSDFMRGTMVMAFFGLRFHAMQFDCISRDDLLVVHRLVALSAVASRARVQLARAQFGSDESLSAIVAMPHADRSALSRLHTRVAAAEMEIRMLAQRHFEDKFTFASCYAYVVLAFVYHGSSVSLSSHFASVAMHRTVDLVARWVDGREPAPSQQVVQEMVHLREGAYWFLTGGMTDTETSSRFLGRAVESLYDDMAPLMSADMVSYVRVELATNVVQAKLRCAVISAWARHRTLDLTALGPDMEGMVLPEALIVIDRAISRDSLFPQLDDLSRTSVDETRHTALGLLIMSAWFFLMRGMLEYAMGRPEDGRKTALLIFNGCIRHLEHDLIDSAVVDLLHFVVCSGARHANDDASFHAAVRCERLLAYVAHVLPTQKRVADVARRMIDDATRQRQGERMLGGFDLSADFAEPSPLPEVTEANFDASSGTFFTHWDE